MPYITEYDYDRYGHITELGKFEGEYWFVPALWWDAEIMCDDIIYDEFDGKPFFVFFVANNPLLAEYFPGDYALILYERDDGFVVSDVRTELGYDFFLRRVYGDDKE